MTSEIMASYNKIFCSSDETGSDGFNKSYSISDSSNIKSKGSERSNNDDSFERFLADNIACYATVEISNLSSSGSSNGGSTVSGGDLKLGSGDADNNDVDIPEDCRNLFNHMMNEIEANNNKINYIMNINKPLQEEIETMNFLQNKEKENYNQLNTKFKKLEIKYDSLAEENKNYIKDFDIYENLYEMDCQIIQNNQYSRRENLIISGIPNLINHQDLEYTVLNVLRVFGLKKISAYDIVACHRLKVKNDNYPARTIVRFVNRKLVGKILKYEFKILRRFVTYK